MLIRNAKVRASYALLGVMLAVHVLCLLAWCSPKPLAASAIAIDEKFQSKIKSIKPIKPIDNCCLKEVKNHCTRGIGSYSKAKCETWDECRLPAAVPVSIDGDDINANLPPKCVQPMPVEPSSRFR